MPVFYLAEGFGFVHIHPFSLSYFQRLVSKSNLGQSAETRCNRRREMGLGGYPDVNPAEARDKTAGHRKQAKASVDPIKARKAGKVKTSTFTTCAVRYILAHRSGWKNTKHAHQWVRTAGFPRQWACPAARRDRYGYGHASSWVNPSRSDTGQRSGAGQCKLLRSDIFTCDGYNFRLN